MRCYLNLATEDCPLLRLQRVRLLLAGPLLPPVGRGEVAAGRGGEGGGGVGRGRGRGGGGGAGHGPGLPGAGVLAARLAELVGHLVLLHVALEDTV